MNKTQTTNYTGISKLYFDKIISEIISLGKLNSSKKKILDFGCGEKQLEKMLNKRYIIMILILHIMKLRTYHL